MGCPRVVRSWGGGMRLVSGRHASEAPNALKRRCKTSTSRQQEGEYLCPYETLGWVRGMGMGIGSCRGVQIMLE